MASKMKWYGPQPTTNISGLLVGVKPRTTMNNTKVVDYFIQTKSGQHPHLVTEIISDRATPINYKELYTKGVSATCYVNSNKPEKREGQDEVPTFTNLRVVAMEKCGLYEENEEGLFMNMNDSEEGVDTDL